MGEHNPTNLVEPQGSIWGCQRFIFVQQSFKSIRFSFLPERHNWKLADNDNTKGNIRIIFKPGSFIRPEAVPPTESNQWEKKFVKQALLHRTFLQTATQERDICGGTPKPSRRNRQSINKLSKAQSPRTSGSPLAGFQALLARLDPDPPRAWEAYEDLRKKLTAYFLHNHHFESEELAEEVLDRIADRDDVATLRNIAEFAFGVARRLRKEDLRSASLRVDVPDLDLIDEHGKGNQSGDSAIIDNMITRSKLSCFQSCLQRLAPLERELIHQYFPAEAGDLEGRRQRLADSMGISIGTLRTRMARVREKLEQDFDRSYYSGNTGHSPQLWTKPAPVMTISSRLEDEQAR